jgi:pyruvate dehydrogenase (quinone)
MPRTVADQFADILATAGVGRVYGAVSDGLAGIVEALHRQGKIEWVYVRDEAVGAFAASAEAHLTGNLAVCAGSWGAGNLNLIRGLLDCHRSRVPVLAIAAQNPSPETGSSAFQELPPQDLFAECSHYCAFVSDGAQMPRALEVGIRIALGERGVSVLAIPQDLALRATGPDLISKPASLILRPPAIVPDESDLDRLAKVLNTANRVTLLCGSGCEGVHAEVVTLANKLKTPVVHALKGKEHTEYNNPYSVGMAGPIGSTSAYYAMTDCDVLLLLGTDFPYQSFFPEGPDVVKAQIDIRPGHIGRRTQVDLGLFGHVKATIAALLPRLDDKEQRSHLDQALKHYGRVRVEFDNYARAATGNHLIHPLQVMTAVSDFASGEAIFTCDVGLPTLWGARCLRMNGRRRLIGSFWHGATRDAVAQAVGAQLAFPGRQVISLSDDGDISMLMEDLQRLVRLKMPVKIVVFNEGGHGRLEPEHHPHSPPMTGEGSAGPNFARSAEAAGILGVRLEDPAEVDAGIQAAFAHPGPAVIDVVVGRTGFPTVGAQMARTAEFYRRRAVVNARGDRWIDLANTSPWADL